MVILHCDMNNFYASVECLYNPGLRDKPVAVAGAQEQRHGIVLAKNYIAKQFGIRTGDTYWQARRKCPDIVFVPPHFSRYKRYSDMAKEIYSEYTDQVQSFGLDECWLDVTGSKAMYGSGQQIADELRERIRFELGVTASVGVSFNKVFAKLGSDMKKPDATTVITRDNYREKVWPLPVSDLLFVGPATTRKLLRIGVDTIGKLASLDYRTVGNMLGKHGRTLWEYANGLEHSPVLRLDEQTPIKSIGNSTTTPRDLVTDADVRLTLYVLCESVSARLRRHGFYARTVQVWLRDNELHSVERQGPLAVPARTVNSLFACAYGLYQKHRLTRPLRSIGVRACNLTPDTQPYQLSLLPENGRIEQEETLECTIDQIRARFGYGAIQRGVMLTDRTLSALNPQADHIIFPDGSM